MHTVSTLIYSNRSLRGAAAADWCMMATVCGAQGGDLRQALTNSDEGVYAWAGHGKSVALDISRGLHFLHTSGVVHRCSHSCRLVHSQGAAHSSALTTARPLSNCVSFAVSGCLGVWDCATQLCPLYKAARGPWSVTGYQGRDRQRAA